MKLTDPDFFKWLVDTRRDLHMHPEIAFEEMGTSDKIAEILEELNIEVQRFDDITGVVGIIRGSADGPTLALRADIDALPIQELNEVPYKSRNNGKMHACGHEASVSILLGTAKYLMNSGMAERLKGNVKFLFQPAEERGAGAKAMIERGVLDHPHVDRIIAGHMEPNLSVGQVGHFQSLGYALTDRFSIEITGKGGHGARPESCIDPIVAGAQLITQLQTIVSRNLPPTSAGVITIGKFASGDVANVIPESAAMEGSIRALSADTRDLICKRLRELVSGIELSFKVQCDLKISEGVPCLTNDTDVAAFLHDISTGILGEENVHYIEPIMGSEDFAFFTEARPGAIMRLGCANEAKGLTFPLHSPYFDIDENVLLLGVKIFTNAIRQYLKA
jgi:amidohydrolase